METCNYVRFSKYAHILCCFLLFLSASIEAECILMTAQILHQHVYELLTHTLGYLNLTTGKIDLSRVYITYHLMYDVENLSSVHDIVHTYTCSSSGKCYNGQVGNIWHETSHYCTYSECNEQLWRIWTVNPKLTCITATAFITTIKLWTSKAPKQRLFSWSIRKSVCTEILKSLYYTVLNISNN